MSTASHDPFARVFSSVADNVNGWVEKAVDSATSMGSLGLKPEVTVSRPPLSSRDVDNIAV